MPTSRLAIVLVLASFLGLAPSVHGQWPQWGGPNRDFIVSPTAEPLEPWPEMGPRVLWVRQLGPGYSALLADDGALFTMTRREAEEVIVSLNPDTGATLWEHAYGAPTEKLGFVDKSWGDAPQATPLLAGESVIGLGFTGILTSVDAATGELRWRHDLPKTQSTGIPYFGHAASPIRVGDSVVVLAGGASAFDLSSGEPRWRNRDFAASYASPILVEGPGGPQIVAAAAGEVVGLDPADGRMLWRREHANQHRTFLSSPLAGTGPNADVVFASAYFLGSLALRLREDGSIEELWQREDLQVSHSNALLVGQTVVASHNRQLVGVDLASGDEVWRQKGVGRSLLLGLGKQVLMLDERGRLSLGEVEPTGFKRLARAKILDGRSWTSPTLVGNRLYVRNQSLAVAVDLATAARGPAETLAGRLEPTPPTSSTPAPAEFLEAVAAVQNAARRGDADGLRGASVAFNRWRDDRTLAPWAHYYQGFASWRLLPLVPAGERLALVDGAVESLSRALELDARHADSHSLLSDLYSAYYRLAPQRAAVIGTLGDEHLERARELAPENPRVLALWALDLATSPPQYGGDPELALETFERAVETLDKALPGPGSASPTSPSPTWGAALARGWQARVLLKLDRRDDAESVLRRALDVAPDFSMGTRLLKTLEEPRGQGGDSR
ncbi:MAG: PQQ-binding-like beta-propeller repeat protein [Acidobacteriota bacterium]